jgi:hypothetical protein
MSSKPNKVLEHEISQDEAYQRSGHPIILPMNSVVRGLMPGYYELQLREKKPRITSKEVKRDA